MPFINHDLLIFDSWLVIRFSHIISSHIEGNITCREALQVKGVILMLVIHTWSFGQQHSGTISSGEGVGANLGQSRMKIFC